MDWLISLSVIVASGLYRPTFRLPIGRFIGRTRAAVSYMLLSLQGELDKSPELRREVEELT